MIRRRHKFGFLSAALMLGFSVVAAGSAQAGPSVPINVTNSIITCDTVAATLTFTPNLRIAPALPVPDVVHISGGHLSGCFDPEFPDLVIKGTIIGVANLTFPSNDCHILDAGAEALSGGFTIRWTSTPQLIPDKYTGVSFSTITTDFAPDAFGVSRARLEATTGMSVPGTAGPPFAGEDGGVTSQLHLMTVEDVATTATTCLSNAGLHTLHVGAGVLNLS